jgi:hemerythrin superfamily protein
MDAIELLKRDHHEVEKLFQRFSSGGNGRGRAKVVERICQELEVHAQIEEEIFYPSVRETGDEELGGQVEEALQEHARAKQQIQALRGMSPDDEGQLEATVSALQQDVEHHVAEEEGEMFPRVAEVMERDQRAQIGEQLAERKGELMGGAVRSASARARGGRQGARLSARARAQSSRGKSARGSQRRTPATKRRRNTSSGRATASSGRARASTGRGGESSVRGRASSGGGASSRGRAKSAQRQRATTKRKSTARKGRGRSAGARRKQARGGRRR